MSKLENVYTQKQLVRIAKRENNTKRGYLVMDPLQGKHIAVSPKTALKLFDDLAQLVIDTYNNEKIVFIGFAETATAIGAQVAISAKSEYIQTTREIVNDVDYLFFSEEHSHATEQKLVKNDMDIVMNEADRIVFVEDEVTTGKTILNIIAVLKKNYPDSKVKFAVASLLNGMTETNLELYGGKQIDLHYLVKTDHSTYDEIADKFKGDGEYISYSNEPQSWTNELNVSNYMNTRRLTDTIKYVETCNNLWSSIEKEMDFEECKSVLIMGTEECMYPALHVGAKLEEKGVEVKSHSTTRSPIATSTEEEYPVHKRFELRSMYDKQRVTYIYDIAKYDKVIVITDSKDIDQEGSNSLLGALRTQNNDITLVRWN